MINDTVKFWATRAIIPVSYGYAIADCCGASYGLFPDPVGICFFQSPTKITDPPEARNSPGFNVWNEAIQTENGMKYWINMRGVSSIPGEEGYRTGGQMQPIYKYTDRQSLSDPNVVSLHLNGVAQYLGKNTIPSSVYGNAPIHVSTEDRLETIFETWKGKYVITIQKDLDLPVHQSFLNEIKDKEVYRSPKFNNRHYNLSKDYLQCGIYKF